MEEKILIHTYSDFPRKHGIYRVHIKDTPQNETLEIRFSLGIFGMLYYHLWNSIGVDWYINDIK